MTTRVKPKVRTVEEYLALPYTIEIYRNDSEGITAYVVRVVELPGCLTQADSFEELEEMYRMPSAHRSKPH